MRISENKIIKDVDRYQSLHPKYISIIDRLIKEYPVTDGSNFEDLVNFKSNITCAKHGWYNYKQGYAQRLVQNIIEQENVSKETWVLDPFCGVGTTNLTALDLGYKSIGFDINPIAILASRTKTHYFTADERQEISQLIEGFELPDIKTEITAGKVINTSFSEEVLDILLKVKTFVESIENPNIQNFFRLALISIIDDCSLKVKDGNGLKFKKNYKPIKDLVDHFLTKAKAMRADLDESNGSRETNIIFGSMIDYEVFGKIHDQRVGISIFSPPYANCFDYCEVYKLEFWIGGFVKSYKDFETYRSMAMRSHVNSKFNHTIKNINTEVDIIADIVSTFNIWNKNIPNMLRGYFDDMESLLTNQKTVLVKGGKCFIVVANSGYKGILVPTDLLIADIANKIGYKVNNIFKARKIRSSSQQMGILNSNYDNLMRESIIEIQNL